MLVDVYIGTYIYINLYYNSRRKRIYNFVMYFLFLCFLDYNIMVKLSVWKIIHFKNWLFPNSVSQMYDTADYSYILPTHRLTVYIMGILLGYCLRYVGRNYQIKKVKVNKSFIWIPIIYVYWKRRNNFWTYY